MKWQYRLGVTPLLFMRWTPVLATPEGETRKISVALFVPEAKDRPFYSSVWQHGDELRQLVIIVVSSDENEGPVFFEFVLKDKRILKKD